MSAYRGRPEFVGAPLECREWPISEVATPFIEVRLVA